MHTLSVIFRLLDSEADYFNVCLVCKFWYRAAQIEQGAHFKSGHLEQLILRFPDADWDWRGLSLNKSISNEFILQHTYLPWIINYLVIKHEFTWKQILTIRAPKNYDYVNAYWNPNITPEVVAKHPEIRWYKASLLRNPNFNITHYTDDMGWNPYTYFSVSLNPNIHKGTGYDTVWDLVHARPDIGWRYKNLSAHIPLDVILNNLDITWDYDKIMKRFYLPLSFDEQLNKQILSNPPKSMEDAWKVVTEHYYSTWRMSNTYIIKWAPLPYAQIVANIHNRSLISNVAVQYPKTALDAQRALELRERHSRSERFAIPLKIGGLDTVQELHFNDLKCMYTGAELSKYRGLRWYNVVNNPNISWDFQGLSYNTFSVQY